MTPEQIIAIGKVCSALLAIVATFQFIVKPMKKFISDFNKIKEYTEENYINNLQMKIMSPFMPLEERVAAGYKYTEELHQNGPVHLEYELLQEEYKKKHGQKYTRVF